MRRAPTDASWAIPVVGPSAGQTGAVSIAAVIYNPTKVSWERLAELVTPAEQAAGWDPGIWLETTEEETGAGLATEAVRRGAAVVLAAGGDGTIRAVAQGLRGSGVPLAVLPHGTGNLLARNLNLALDDLPGAVAAAFDGVTRPVDVAVARLLRLEGTAEEHVFVVMAGMGLDAQIMSTTDERLKRRVGMLAYVKAGAEALLRDRRMRVSYQFDDGSFGSARLHTVLIGNCGSIGGNVMLMPDALVDDGILDILAVRPQGLFGWVRVAWRVLVDNAFVRKMLPGRESRTDRTREFLYRQAERVQLRLRGPEEIELDGDHLGEVVEVEIAVDPGALLVRMPADWEPQAP